MHCFYTQKQAGLSLLTKVVEISFEIVSPVENTATLLWFCVFDSMQMFKGRLFNIQEELWRASWYLKGSQLADDPLRFLLIIIIIKIYFVFCFSPLTACPSSCARRDMDKDAGTQVSFSRLTFLGLEGGAGWTTPCLNTLSSLINSYVPYFFLATCTKQQQQQNIYCVTYSAYDDEKVINSFFFLFICALCVKKKLC